MFVSKKEYKRQILELKEEIRHNCISKSEIITLKNQFEALKRLLKFQNDYGYSLTMTGGAIKPYSYSITLPDGKTIETLAEPNTTQSYETKIKEPLTSMGIVNASPGLMFTTNAGAIIGAPKSAKNKRKKK